MVIREIEDKMEIQIPQYTAMRWAVYDWDGMFRAFETKADAEK